KRRLFLAAERPPAAVNVGDPHGRLLAEELHGGQPLVTFGIADDADVRPEELELDGAGARFRAAGIPLATRLRARLHVENVLAAVAAARLLGLPEEAVARGVAEVSGVPG